VCTESNGTNLGQQFVISKQRNWGEPR